MDASLVGQLAALVVSLLWTLCPLFFAAASMRIGALSVNAIRMVFAGLLLSIAHFFVLGRIIPAASTGQWFFMGLSGIVGLVIGDLCYFGALMSLGPRLSLLIMATNPIFSLIAGWLALGEVLDGWSFIGICVTLFGVLWVVAQRNGGKAKAEKRDSAKTSRGVLLGFAAAICQGTGLVISKYGMQFAASEGVPNLNPLSATLMRMLVAVAVMWAGTAVFGKLPELFESFRDRKAVLQTFIGAVLGPFLGIWLSMVAISSTATGIAATLMSLMPVLVIPILWIFYRQKTGWKGILGAIIAVSGVAIIFLA
ncbi:MAG: DMT family transporter [Candidatus Thermoplasmatota archaeon]|nr:DMT family transporter [Candidatus Thermoplasmatota archaeon]